MKKISLLFTFLIILFSGCSSDNDDPINDSEWEEIMSYLTGLGEFEGIDTYEDGKDEHELKFGISNEFKGNLVLYQFDGYLYDGERIGDWIYRGIFNKNQVSGKIGNLTLESTYYQEIDDDHDYEYKEDCKVIIRSVKDFIIQFTYYDEDGVDTQIIKNK